jgi:DNA-directed RNA polymerase specialized sigma24 family protein
MIEDSASFPSTHWTQLRVLDGPRNAGQKEVLNALITRYWKPAYAYVCRRGFEAEAADLTQDFFVLSLSRDLFSQADQACGRFRSFFLTCLNRFLIDAYRRRRSRLPPAGIVSIHDLSLGRNPVYEPSVQETPEDVFHRMWVHEILVRVWTELQWQLQAAGQAAHGELFRRRLYEPMMAGTRQPPLAEIAQEFGLTRKEASNRIRRRRAVLSPLADRRDPTVRDDEGGSGI